MTKGTLKSLNLPAAGSDDVDAYVRERGVPMLAPVATGVEPAKPAPSTKMAIEVPNYLPAKLRKLAFEQDCTIRHIILEALHNAGCEIAPEDRTKDGRRASR